VRGAGSFTSAIGLYSARAARQLRDSASGKYGFPDDRLVCAQTRVMAVLRLDGNDRFCDRRLPHLPACSQGGKKHSNASSRPGRLVRSTGYSSVGALGHRHRCLAATAGAHGSISLCRRRNAILRGKFLLALTVGRIVRYSSGVPGSRYGRQMLTAVMSQLRHPVLIAVIGLTARQSRLSFSCAQTNTVSEHTLRPTSMLGVATMCLAPVQTREFVTRAGQHSGGNG